ncbi:DUF6274 family protein [Streptomyces sp. ME08-AFT2]|nr:DUF6274 family protein [Streptomyces sp. ME08-AFT2]MDX3315051.1 DUF6274 family protein [Streptomyces sp. ME08-AFT2]
MTASVRHETRALLRAHLSAASSYRHLTRHCPICHRLLKLAMDGAPWGVRTPAGALERLTEGIADRTAQGITQETAQGESLPPRDTDAAEWAGATAAADATDARPV